MFPLELLSNWRVWLGIVFLLLAGYAQYWKSEARAYKDQLTVFTAQVESIGKQAIERNRRIEDANKSRIDVAIANRDASIARLRLLVQQANTRTSVLPSTAGTAQDPSRVCFDKAKLDESLKQFIGSAAGIAQEGDSAIIDNKAWLSSWPK